MKYKLLNRQKLPKLIQQEIEICKCIYKFLKIEFTMKQFLTKRTSCQIFEEDVIPHAILSQNGEEREYVFQLIL